LDYGDYLVRLYQDKLELLQKVLETVGFYIENVEEIEFAYILTSVK
jgi:hypothetical protein